MTDEVLLKTADALVRILRLDPGEATPWHWHTEADDQMVCLEGHVSLEMSDPDEAAELLCGAIGEGGPPASAPRDERWSDGLTLSSDPGPRKA
jgi:hypothetical protein